MVRWRSGRSRGPPVSSGSAGSSRASSAPGDSTGTRAAASSIASGNLFAVVEHQQRFTVLKREGQPPQKGLVRAFLDAQDLSDGGNHERWVADGSEVDEEHSVGKARHEVGRDAEREAGLADPAG